MIKDLKQLEVLKSKTEEKISLIVKQISDLAREKKVYERQLSEVQKRINTTLEDVVVTEHAIVRYFERYLNFDMEEIKNKILPKDVKPKIKELRNCEFPVNGFSIIVQNNKVVTVIKK